MKELNISQSDITKSEATNNLINLTECNKIPLKVDQAQLICKDINNILKERSLDLIIEPEDLFNPLRYEAKEKAEIYMLNWTSIKMIRTMYFRIF